MERARFLTPFEVDMRLNSRFTVKQRVYIIGAASVLCGLVVVWIYDLPILLGVLGGVGVFAAYLYYFEMHTATDDTEQLTQRYRLLFDEPPYIVARSRGFLGFADRSRLVAACYPDRLVVSNVKTAADIPDEIFAPQGADDLARLPSYGAPRVWTHDEIDSIDIHLGRTFEREFTFMVHGSDGRFTFALHSEDGRSFAEGLQSLLGEKVHRSSDKPASIHRKRLRAMLGICVLMDATAVFLVWIAGANGATGTGMQLLADVRDRLGPTKTIALLTFLCLFVNMLLMLIASLDPTHGGPDSEA